MTYIHRKDCRKFCWGI